MSAASRTDSDKRPRIVVSLGDPNGIGPEILVKCLADNKLTGEIDIVPVGSSAVLRYYWERHNYSKTLDAGSAELVAIPEPVGFEFKPGELSKLAGEHSMTCVEAAVNICIEGAADAMVTCPISKEAIALAGFDFPGHTEFIAEKTSAASHLMMMVSDKMRVALVTAHIPISDVTQSLTVRGILDTIENTARSLRDDFGIDPARIAVLGLNPHAGDGGVLGSEESSLISPAIMDVGENAVVSGPFPADGFFGSSSWRDYDAIIAMYHDQGLIPFKALSFGKGVNFTAGLPIVRTSPDHGTAFDIAGQGVAAEGSLKTAIRLAADIARRRTS